jgi:hypothetical protein
MLVETDVTDDGTHRILFDGVKSLSDHHVDLMGEKSWRYVVDGLEISPPRASRSIDDVEGDIDAYQVKVLLGCKLGRVTPIAKRTKLRSLPSTGRKLRKRLPRTHRGVLGEINAR